MPPPRKSRKNGPFGVVPPAGMGRCALRCATRPVGTGDVIGRGWPRCSTWTIDVRLLVRFGPSAPGTPSASRSPDVQQQPRLAGAERPKCVRDGLRPGGQLLAKTGHSGVSSRSLTRPPKRRQSQKTHIFQSTSELELREDTTVWAKNILCPKVDQVGQKLAASALGSKNLQNWRGYLWPPPP